MFHTNTQTMNEPNIKELADKAIYQSDDGVLRKISNAYLLAQMVSSHWMDQNPRNIQLNVVNERKLNREFANIIHDIMSDKKWWLFGRSRVKLYTRRTDYQDNFQIIVHFFGKGETKLSIHFLTPGRFRPKNLAWSTVWSPPKSPMLATFFGYSSTRTAPIANGKQQKEVNNCILFVKYLICALAKAIFDIDDITDCEDGKVSEDGTTIPFVIFVGHLLNPV